MAENIRHSHRIASKWPICYNATPESTRSWRHNQGESLSRKCSLPCFQMTLILYPNLKTNMEPKVFGWDDSPENQGEHLRLLKNGFVFERSFLFGSIFLGPLQLAGLTGLRPVARLQHGVPQAWRMRMKNGVWLGPVILQMVPPAVAQMPSCHRANLLCRFECWPRKLGRFVLKILMRLETLWALMVNSTRATTSRCRHGPVEGVGSNDPQLTHHHQQ